jgi:hypothetical protein
VVLREATPGSDTAAQVRFTRDWSRVRCMDAEADIALLEALEQEIAQRLRVGATLHDPKELLPYLQDTLSNSLQITAAQPTLAENLSTEMELLLRLYVEPIKVPRVRLKSGRAQLQAAMRSEFERTGAWPLMNKRIVAARYTRPGDPLRIDCGYRSDIGERRVRLFQAVSLDGDIEAAKSLAYSAPQLRDGVSRIEAADCELTAVVEPLRVIGDGGNQGDEASDRYRFGIETMERQLIRVITLNDLARAASTAQRELGL